MKKIILKMKIALTNISRVLMSFLFINLNLSYINKSFAVTAAKATAEIMCYDTQPMNDPTTIELPEIATGLGMPETISLKNIFILLVPIVVAVVGVILVVRNKKQKEKMEKNDDKKD